MIIDNRSCVLLTLYKKVVCETKPKNSPYQANCCAAMVAINFK